MQVAERDGNEFTLDTWVALLAGSNPWASGERRSEAWTRLLALAEVFCAAVTLGTLWWAHSGSPGRHTSTIVIGSVAMLALMVHPALRIALVPVPSLGVGTNLAYRIAGITAVFLTIYALMPRWNTLWCTSLAVAGGIDASLTCTELGWQARPAVWYRHFLRSGFHLGIVGAVLATFAMGGTSRWPVVVPLFAVLHLWLAVAMVTLWVISSLREADRIERAQAIADVIEAEHRQRAHWLHDDVCAQLRLVSLELQTNSATTEEILGHLDDFDHQLRLRQLDELFGAGSVRVAELLQPYIRHAQNRGVTIAAVPAFEEAAVQLSERSARLTARAANVLTSNALNAGASTISYDVLTADGFVRLTVTDDGPGFRLSEVPHGRGLWTLIDDLKPGGLLIDSPAGGGSIVTATIPYTAKDSRGFHTARR